jgi:hypothetical protein
MPPLAIAVLALWIGSAVSGWNGFNPWLFVPVSVMALHIIRGSLKMRQARGRNGIDLEPDGFSMTDANAVLLGTTLVQHVVIFVVAAGISGLVR